MVFGDSIVADVLAFLAQPIVIALATLVAFVVLGYFVGRLNERLLTALNVDAAVEGTAFERTATGLGSSTVEVIARLSSWFVYGIGVLVALYIVGVLEPTLFWQEVTRLVPQLFVAVFVLLVGVIAGDKADVVITERMRSVKLPEVTLVGTVVKYSIIYVAVLIALGQIGVATGALLVLLGSYFFGLVVISAVACRDLLASGAAGLYLFLNQPYGIGDTVRIGDRSGVVQEVELFVTRIENDGEEFIVPNRTVFEDGASRLRG